MDCSEIERLIDQKIAEHELRFTLAGLATIGLISLALLALK